MPPCGGDNARLIRGTYTMNVVDFFELVTPSQGFLILAEPLEIPGAKTNPMRHHVFRDMQNLIDKACQLNFEAKNVFFALAGYKEEKVWNPTARTHDGTLGKWQTRTQSNAWWLRTLFLDLDIDADPTPHKATQTYPTKPEAIKALRDFTMKVGLPPPLVLDSGGGIHVYWPFDRDLEKAEWLPLAEKLKALCLNEGLRIDPAVPADSARVLRVLGCHNMKKANARPVEMLMRGKGPFSVEQIEAVFSMYESANGAIQLPRKAPRMYAPTPLAGGEEGNLQRHVDPINFGRMSFACAALGGQIAERGANASEPLWHFMIGLAKFAEANAEQALLSISDRHPGFDRARMLDKAARWPAGPSRCVKIQEHDPASCAGCPHWGKITSPAQLGAHAEAAVVPQVEQIDEDTGLVIAMDILAPPPGYTIEANRVVMEKSDKNGNVDVEVVCPNQLYPLRILRHTANNETTERTIWRAKLAKMGEVDLDMPQALIADSRALHKFLLNNGLYATSTETASIQLYMSAYLKKLSDEQARERVYDRLGWQGEDHNDGFVVGPRRVNMDGSIVKCNVNTHVKNITKGKVDLAGSMEEWRDSMTFYLGDEYRGHRFFLYLALGAPIFHMTGHKGMMIHACGESGRGKTTCLDACGSIWGHPEALRINGNNDGTTTNALFNTIGTFHSLPVLLDEITSRDDGQMAEFALNISQGRGKDRMRGSEHDGKVVTWETPILSTANTDLVTRIFSSRKDAQPHMMRVVSVDFYLPNKSAAAVNRANQFAKAIRANYGHAGLAFAQFVAANYSAVHAEVDRAMSEINVALGGSQLSAERFWVAAIATALVAGKIAKRLQLWDFPLKDDYEWMKGHITSMREVQDGQQSSPLEMLSEFLEASIDNTLILTAKASSNLDNVARAPHRALHIRHEVDKQLIYISRSAILSYLMDNRVSAKEVERELMQSGVLVDKSKLKVLGADTPFAKAQTRCWLVNAACLGPAHVALTQAATMTNVTSLRPTGS